MPWTWGVRGFLNLKGWKLIEKPDQEIIRLQYCLLIVLKGIHDDYETFKTGFNYKKYQISFNARYCRANWF